MNEILIDKTGQAEVITASAGSLTVIVPIRIKRRGSRKAVALPDGSAVQPRPWDDTPTPIQLALARGHRWLAMVEPTRRARCPRWPSARGWIGPLSCLSALAIDPLAGESLELRPEAALQKCREEVEDVDTERRIEDEVHPIGVLPDPAGEVRFIQAGDADALAVFAQGGCQRSSNSGSVLMRVCVLAESI
jgi:hypothetical protein